MKILLIEDDRELAESMKFQLEKEGYETDICDDGEEGLYYMKERSHDLVILDRMLPSMDGITVLQEARKNHVSTPVIMLTALGELQDKLTGLKGGADDYMVKPFAFEELLARIQCMVRRPGRWENTAVLSLGDLIFDPESGRLEGNGKECTLSKREGALLELMLRNAGQTLPRETSIAECILILIVAILAYRTRSSLDVLLSEHASKVGRNQAVALHLHWVNP